MPYCAQYCFVTGGDSLTNCQLGLDDECICTESTDDVLRAVMKTCVEIKYHCISLVKYLWMIELTSSGDIWPIFAEFCVTEGYLDSSETALPSSMTATADPSTIISAILTNTPSTTTSAIDTTEPTAPAAESDSSSANDDDASSSSRLSPAAKAGIAIGVTLPIIAGAVLLALWRKRRKGISSDKDGETAMPELGSGDNADRHELGPEAKLFGAGSKTLAELESGHVMAEMDGTSCLVYGLETNDTGDETKTTAELDGTPPGPDSSTRSPRSPADRGANAARAPARKYCESNTSTSPSPNAGEGEQLPCEDRG
ncbi:transmembrane alpha-helix domain-containing protein [Colletotrichum asianum]